MPNLNENQVATLKVLIEMYERDLDILKTELRLREQGTIVSTKAGIERVLARMDDIKNRLKAYLALENDHY